MSTNGQQSETSSTGKKQSILDAPLEGAEIKVVPSGAYPARLMAVSEPFDVPLPPQYRKRGRVSQLTGTEDRATKINLVWAVKLRDGTIGRTSWMVSSPDGKVWNTSKLWQVMETLANGDPALWNEHGLVRGVTLRNFLGRVCQVQVENVPSKKNPAQIYAQVSNIMSAVDGLSYPTDEEGHTIMAAVDEQADESSEGIPF